VCGGTVGNFKFDKETNQTQATLSITSSDTTSICLVFENNVKGVQNIEVLLPGFSSKEAMALNPLMIQQLKRFSTVRFLAMNPFNRDFIVSWKDRTTIDKNPSWSNFCCPMNRDDGAVPWEVVVDIANTVQTANIWINLPVSADDEYFTELTGLLKQQLNSNITVFYECGNEMWNGGFIGS
jgi:hypothetical protein